MDIKICSRCKQEKDISEFNKEKKNKDGLYVYCRDCQHKYYKEWFLEKYKKDDNWRKKFKHKSRDYYRKNPLARREYSKKRRDNIRFEALKYYSKNEIPICACCKETEIRFLSFDHINNDGSKQRKKMKSNEVIGEWLRRNNYPDGIQVLCFNCNLSKGFYGECPHIEEQKKILGL